MTDRERLTGDKLLQRLVALVGERRGEEVVALDVRELVDYMDFLLFVNARSERQNRAICDHVVREMKREATVPLSRAGYEGGTWICVDFVDVVLHLFTPETRRHYDLDLLWADAKRVELPGTVPGALSEAVGE